MEVVVIGGGPAGMMSAYQAAKKGHSATVIEKNDKLGKKLFITGKGRGNVTNNCDKDTLLKNVVRNSKFLYSSFSRFNAQDIIRFFEQYDCPLKTERGNRVFPISDHAYSLTDALKKAMKKNKVNILLNSECKNISQCEEFLKYKFIIEYNINGISKKIYCDKVIIATGGLSYPSTGSTGDGYCFAKKFGHNIMPTFPSLTGIDVEKKDIEFENQGLAGLTLKNINYKIYNRKFPTKKVFEDFGELLFTHSGVSGPVVLSSTSFIADRNDISDLIIEIDLKPSYSVEELDKRLLDIIEKNKNKIISNLLIELLPKSIIPIVLFKTCKEICREKCEVYNNYIFSKKANDLSKKERKILVHILKHYTLNVINLRGYDEAIITKGGVNIKEIDNKTMESKIIKGLYFAGEVMDIDCLTGGFNLTVAFSTAFVAGDSI